jgi:hypothetical protein
MIVNSNIIDFQIGADGRTGVLVGRSETPAKPFDSSDFSKCCAGDDSIPIRPLSQLAAADFANFNFEL